MGLCNARHGRAMLADCARAGLCTAVAGSREARGSRSVEYNLRQRAAEQAFVSWEVAIAYGTSRSQEPAARSGLAASAQRGLMTGVV